jgi:hypothetical protein
LATVLSMASRNRTTATTEVTASVQTTTRLTAEEEQVLRMRGGYAAPDRMRLEAKDGGDLTVRAALREMELRALEMSGRLQALKAEVNADRAPMSSSKKKIIEGLGGRLGSDS